MMRVNIEVIDKVLNNLLTTTYQALKNVQHVRVPHWQDLKLTRIKSGQFIYKDKRDISVYPLFRIDDIESIKYNKQPISYNGPIYEAIEKKLIKGISVFLNGFYIPVDKVNLITDARYHYLEIKHFGGVDIEYTNPNNINTFKGEMIFELPKVRGNFKDKVMLKIESSNPNELITYVNGNKLDTDRIPSYMISDTDTNIIKLSCNDISISKLHFYTETYGFPGDYEIKTIVYPDGYTTSYLQDTNYSLSFYNGIYRNNPIVNGMIPSNKETIIPNLPYDYKIYKGKDNIGWIDPVNKTQDRIFTDNVFCFKDGIVSDVIDKGMNTFKCETNIEYFMYYHEHGNKTSDNMYKWSKLTRSLERLKSGDYDEYIKHIADPFDFIFEPSKFIEDRIYDICQYVAEYNSQLLEPYAEHFSDIDQVTYTGEEIKKISSQRYDNNYIHYFRKRKMREYNRDFLLFRNGLLLDETLINRNYNRNYTSIFLDDIQDDDVFDFLIFKRVYNDVIPIEVDAYKNIQTISKYIPFRDLIIQTHDIDFHLYPHIPRKEELQYEIASSVDNEIEDIGGGNVKIKVNDYYYHKPLFISSRRKFVHHRFTIDGEEMMIEKLYKILLPDKFRYCHNRHQYLIFWNGRKIDNSDALVCLNHPNLPFDKRFIHINKRCDIGDYIDVFYVPVEMREIFTKTEITNRGYIDIADGELGYPFNSKNCSIFMNGKRLSQKYSLDITSKSDRVIHDVKTRKNISILQHIDYNDTVFEMMRVIRDMWSKMIDGLSEEERDDLFGQDLLITDTEEDIRANSYEKYMVIYEVIRRYWWLNPHRLKVVSPSFYIYEDKNGELVLPIYSSIKMLNIPLLYVLFGKDKDYYNFDINNDVLVMDAAKKYITVEDTLIYKYYYFNTLFIFIPDVQNGTLWLDNDEKLIDLILDTEDPQIKFRDKYIIDAGLIYEFDLPASFQGGMTAIDADNVVPYFFESRVCQKQLFMNPIPVDAALEQIKNLPPIIKP